MSKAKLRIAEEFFADLAEVYLARILDRVKGAVGSLVEFPEMGSPLMRRSLIGRYGEGLRQIPISTLIIVYRCDGETVDILALV